MQRSEGSLIIPSRVLSTKSPRSAQHENYSVFKTTQKIKTDSIGNSRGNKNRAKRKEHLPRSLFSLEKKVIYFIFQAHTPSVAKLYETIWCPTVAGQRGASANQSGTTYCLN